MSAEKSGLTATTAIIEIVLTAIGIMNVVDAAVEVVTAEIRIGDGNPIEKDGYSIVE